jgi:hypothetical protein
MKRFLGALLVAVLCLSSVPAFASRTCSGANSTDYLQAASNAAYNFSAFGTGSIALWLKRGNIGVTSVPLIQPTGFYGLQIFSDNKLYAETGGSNSSPTTLTDTAGWHHIVITWNVTTVTIYLDNTNVTNASSGHIASGQDVINVCTDGSLTTFNGLVAYIGVWNTELTSGNVATLFTSTTPETVGTGNVASWHLCNTGDLTDSSATNNPLVAQGAGAVWSSDNPSIGCGGGGAVETFGFYYRRAS